MALLDPNQDDLLRPKKKKRLKYGNIKIDVDGYTWDSLAECARYVQLAALKAQAAREGQEFGFIVKPTYTFACGVKYTPDFEVWNRAGRWIEDVKGKATDVFIIKKKLMKHEYGYDVRIVKVHPKTARTLVSAYAMKVNG